MQMENIYTSIVLDKRQIKSNGTYPVKIRVFTPQPRKQKLYRTNIDLTESDFEKSWNSIRPQGKHKATKKILESLLEKAESIKTELHPFSFNEFEKKLYNRKGAELTLKFQYQNKIDLLKNRGQISTAETYQLAEKSFINYLKSAEANATELGINKVYSNLTFKEINVDWLEGYENFMISKNGKSTTTVSIYVRTLRKLFNDLISDNVLEPDFYPFGKKKFVIPSSKNIKKALNKVELKALFESIPSTPEQQKAKDFWFFSYVCNGINIKDILLLRYNDIEGEEIHYKRAKTSSTSKGNQQTIEIILNDFTKDIIRMHGTGGQGKDLVFDILDRDMTPEEQNRAVKNFTKYINQHLKKLAASIGMTSKISTYWARHSFASNYLLSGANISDVMESLGHSNISTTQNYLKSLDKTTRKSFAKNAMNF